MINKFEETQYISALKQYIEKDVQHAKRHKANILIHANRKDYGPGFHFVSVTVNGDIGQVIIEDLQTIFGNCSNMFTTKDSSFTFVSNTLCIKSNDSICGEISINVT